MRKLNPTAPPQTTIEAGLAVEDLHGSLFRTLAARADLDPGSQQLVVGGIGSGKTIELLMAARWLEQQGQTLPVYLDISAETDLSGLNSGALLAGFGLRYLRYAYPRRLKFSARHYLLIKVVQINGVLIPQDLAPEECRDGVATN